MAGVWITGSELVGWLSELVGRKLGLGVTEVDLEQAIQRLDLTELWPDDLSAMYRYRSEAIEELARAALESFGDPDAGRIRRSPLVTLNLLREFPQFPEALAVMDFVLTEIGSLADAAKPDSVIKPTSIVSRVGEQWGADGLRFAKRLLEEVNVHLYVSPWTSVARSEFENRAALRSLFESECLPAELGPFFDQRFIDFLHANPDAITTVHWRQFEGLVGEWLRRAGLRVQMGPGRNDDGIDVRAWDAAASVDTPALLLVQCKREKAKIGKVIVKALAADVEFEGATAGLVVTTSSWSPGAREVVASRNYPIAEANKGTVASWLERMRTPGAGAWLAE
ncbi:restriction endonuclease [Microbispora hainanensis]|uniref:restriction endonuclease n=1 Tax=Microbispora hainanensis TaxID=568844 RepID=UPI0033EE144F